MKRYLFALTGMVIGCVLGWFVPEWIYPWDSIELSSVGSEAVGRIFSFFGLCLGGPLGFVLGSWFSSYYFPEAPVVPFEPPPPDPHKVEDNLG